jgi:hypothetical protein
VLDAAFFRPPCAFDCLTPAQVLYGLGGRFAASSCVVKDHSEIACLTVPGVGRDLPWTVYVAGQRSREAAVSSYTPPFLYAGTNEAGFQTVGDFEVRGCS